MADKKLSEVTKVTDMAYVPVILSDGSVGQIAKADLASVVAELMNTNKLFPFMRRGTISTDNLDDATEEGIYIISGTSANSMITDWGAMLVLKGYTSTVQILLPVNNSKFIGRRTRLSSGWTNWFQFEGVQLT